MSNGSNNDELPRGWECPALSEIAQINPPLDRSINDDKVEVNFVPMRAVDIEGGGLVTPEVRAYGDVKRGYTSFLAQDVIMAKITPCMENGKTAVVPDLPGSVCFGSTEFHVIRPENGVSPRWIANFLLQHEIRRRAMRAMTGGVGQMRVPASFLEGLRIPLPSSAEHTRIADALDELLSDLDVGVAAIERVRAKLAQYRASVLKAAVEGKLTAEWRQQHAYTEPAAELLTRILDERRRRWEEDQLRKWKNNGKEPPRNWKAKYKEAPAPDTSHLMPLPEGWCWATWAQVGFSQNGRPFPSRDYQESGVKLLRPGNLHASGEMRWTQRNTRYMPTKYAELSPDLIVAGGELIINLTAQSLKDDFLGRVCITADGEHCLLNQRLARLTPLIILPKFMLWMFKSAHFRQFVSDLNTGSLIQHMFTSQLENYVFPLPPRDEQAACVEAIEDQLSVIEHLENDLATKVESSRALRQTILSKAFTGQLVSQELDEGSGSELLAQITADREARRREVAAAKQISTSNGSFRNRRAPRSKTIAKRK